jgi:hypothetical protein
MPREFKDRYAIELAAYRAAWRHGDRASAWRYLERAHIVGQYHPFSHSGSHWRMLVFALRTGDGRELCGQLLRLSGGWLGSLLNRVPVGNTGGANVPIFAPLPIPADLRQLLAQADTQATGLSGLKRSV